MSGSFDPFDLPPSPFYGEDHRSFQSQVRRFVEAEIRPHVDTWDESGEFPRELYSRAGTLGLLGLGFPESLGGTGADPFFGLILSQEIARAGSGGLAAGLYSHSIALPPIVRFADADLARRLVPPVLRGERIAALAVSEPGAGSDVAAIRTRARREGEHYVVDGTKTFITSGMRADLLTVAVRTGGDGADGLSLLVIEGEPEGLSRTPLKKMGWWCSDTATLYFEGVRVPVSNRIGPEDAGFSMLMVNFNRERLGLAALALGFAKLCLRETAAYARERIVFGRPLIDNQVIRHKLADMTMRIQATQGYLETLAWRVGRGEEPIAEICLAKNQASLTLEFCAREAVQTLGGAGYIRPHAVERIYREVRVNAIGGGAEEILRDLAARQLGFTGGERRR